MLASGRSIPSTNNRSRQRIDSFSIEQIIIFVHIGESVDWTIGRLWVQGLLK